MKQIIFLSVSINMLLFGIACRDVRIKPEQSNMKSTQSVYNIAVKTIDGAETNLATYRGKKILLVNVASECGYTPQYKDLQKLQEQFDSKVVVLGFPSNDFGGQEPGSNAEIKNFCERNYKITFPMFDKITVVGEGQHPLYQWLSQKNLNGWNEKAPSWNFCKYLLDENGELIGYYNSSVNPLSDEIINKL